MANSILWKLPLHPCKVSSIGVAHLRCCRIVTNALKKQEKNIDLKSRSLQYQKIKKLNDKNLMFNQSNLVQTLDLHEMIANIGGPNKNNALGVS